MRNNSDMDSHLTLALGLLGAIVTAAAMVLLLPAMAERHSEAQSLPKPEIVTPSNEAALDRAAGSERLPKAQRPPETLLNPSPAVASND
jgi:hypothetical protein